MSLFLTKYNLEVGGQYTDGEVRVYRQYVSVLTQGNASANTVNASANNTLAFTQTATAGRGFSVADTLNLTDEAVRETIFEIDDTLNLSEAFVFSWVHNVSVDDTLVFSQSLIKPVPVSAENTLLFSEDWIDEYILEDRKLASDTLNFVQTVQTLSGIDVTDTLNLSDTVAVYNSSRPVSASNHMFLQQSMPTPHRLWIEDTLELSDMARVPIVYAIAQTLNLTQEFNITSLEQTLNFVQTVGFGKSKSISQTMNLTDTMTVTGIFMRSVSDDLGIGHALTWVEDTPCNRKSYTPFMGENTIPGAVTPPSVELPVVQSNPTSDRFLLYTPARGGRTTTVSLRAPEMDNRDRNAYTRVTRETRGGKLYVFADPDWPKIRTMVVTIIGLLKTDVEALQTFFQDTLGQEIGVTDWEGRQWAGVITNPDEPATQDGVDRWTVTFSLEGELLEGYHPGTGNDSALNLTDSATYVVV